MKLNLSYYRRSFLFMIALLSFECLLAQAITTIYTDYNNYYASGNGNISATIPNRSHNLLAFSYNGVTYTTGVKDSALAANNIIRTQGNYQSLPASFIGGNVGASTFILVPAADDGNAASAVMPYPSLKIIDALTDGVKGLNIGSGVTNLPKSATLTFPVSSIDLNSVTDAKPDLIFTQIAAIAAGDPPDTVYFVNNADVQIGNNILVSWAGISIVGSHSCDLYTLSAGACNTATVNGLNSVAQPKDFRLAAYRLSEFGLTAGNIGSVAKLILKPGGTSDPAFVSNNVDAFTVTSTLPVTFTKIAAIQITNGVEVKWQTASEFNNDRFIVERSIDGRSFTAFGSIVAAGNSNQVRDYEYFDPSIVTGKTFYRVKQVDIDGHYMYSDVAAIIPLNKKLLTLTPNPASAYVKVITDLKKGDRILILSATGTLVSSQTITSAMNETVISLTTMPAGSYQLVWTNGADRAHASFIIVK